MAGLSPTQLRHLDQEGYLVAEDVLDPERDIAPLMAEYEAVLDGLAGMLLSEGAVRSDYRGLSFAARLIRLCQESGRNFPQHFDFSLPQSGVRPDTPIHLGPAVFGLLRSPRLLDVVESVLGPEIYSNPVQHIRIKPPARAVAAETRSSLVTATPWHQDNGVVLPEADEATILTVWIPITEATVENGCLQVVPASHREGLVSHCPTDQGVAILPKLVPRERALPLPMQPGSVLLMHQRTMHSSLENRTDDQVRISLDLRYQPIGQPTGRPAFPGFVARSRAHPEAELHDPAAWAASWLAARATLAEREDPSFNRWRADAPVCA